MPTRDPDENDVEMAAHYEPGVEQQRLTTWGRLEFIRTTEILSRYLPAPPAVIADVGGGPGAYALALATQSYEVHLLDPLALHVEQAREASAALEGSELASIEQGDARELPFADRSVDVVLLLGPLYHLVETEDRLQALAEATSSSTGRPVGSCGDLSVRLHLRRPGQGLPRRAAVRRDRRARRSRRPASQSRTTSGLVHHRLLPSSGRAARRGSRCWLRPRRAARRGGTGGWLADLSSWLDDDGRHKALLAAIRRVESEPSLLGASPHLLAVAHAV